MPKLRFRDYICAGMSKKDDDHVAKTSPIYLRLELAQAKNFEQVINQNEADKPET